MTVVHSNSSQYGCSPLSKNILGSHIIAAEICRLDSLHWSSRTSPQHPTVFNILLRKTYLLLYDSFRNNSFVQIHKNFWSAKCNWETSAAGCLCLLRGHPLTVLFLTEIMWLVCSYGPSLKKKKKNICLRLSFYSLSLKRLGQRKAKKIRITDQLQTTQLCFSSAKTYRTNTLNWLFINTCRLTIRWIATHAIFLRANQLFDSSL